MNLVTNDRTGANLPTHLPPMTDRALRTCVTRLVPPITPSHTRYSIAVCDAPSDALRQALANRSARIDAWLLPAGPEAATEVYKDLVATMSVPSADKETELREFRGFVEAAARLPLFALTTACIAFRDGKVGDGKWMPKPGQICVEAGKRVAELAKERREIQAVLTAEAKAPVADAERKAQNLAEAAAFVAGVRSMEAALRRPTMTDDQIAEAKAVSDAWSAGKPDPRPLPMASDYLRRKMGVADRDMVPDIPAVTHDAA